MADLKDYMKKLKEDEASISEAQKKKGIKPKEIDPEVAESFLRDKENQMSNLPMVEQMFKNLGHLAPDHNIFNYYKNLAKIELQRKIWLKRHPPAPLHYKRKKPDYTIIQQKKVIPRGSLHALPWKLNIGKMRSEVELPPEPELRTASLLAIKYGGKSLPRPWHKYRKVLHHRRILAREQDDFIDYEFTTRERSINTPMSAVLFLHILEIANVSATTPTLLPSLPICFYCVISVGHTKKASKITLGRRIKNAKLDFSIHCSLDISSIRNHHSNNVKIEVWCFQDPETQYVIGLTEVHLYELIKDIHGFQSLPMWVDGMKTGLLSFEFAFAYGCLGYGHSNQIKNTAIEIFDTLGNSMFPRVSLYSNTNEEVITTPFETRIPSTLKLLDSESMLQQLAYLPPQFINGTYLEGSTKCIPIPMKLERVHFYEGLPIHCPVNNKIYQSSVEADFNDVYGEYIVIRHRKDRLYYLHDLVNGPQNDIEETDMATYLFQELHQKDYEQILDNDDDAVRHGVNYVYPRVYKCDERDPIVLTKEDEEFMDQFPSLVRQSGYLALLFGYSPLPPPETFLNDMSFPLIITKKERIQWKRYGIKPMAAYCFVSLKNFWKSIKKLWMYFFPDVTQLHVPDISVTTASVPGSVTRIHSYFVSEDKDRNVTEVMRLVQKTTALLALEEVEEEAKKEEEDSLKGIHHSNPLEQPVDSVPSACPAIKHDRKQSEQQPNKSEVQKPNETKEIVAENVPKFFVNSLYDSAIVHEKRKRPQAQAESSGAHAPPNFYKF